jgi:glycosyltransferase involved in cell wall biosynthesis
MNTAAPKRLLMISTDRNILVEGSAVRVRQIEYAKQFDEVHIIVFSKKRKAGAPKEFVLSENCWAYATDSWSPFLYTQDAVSLGKFIISKKGITDITCQDPFLTGMAGVTLKKKFPHIHLELQVHTDIGSPYFGYSWGNKIRKVLARLYIPYADHVRVVSNKIRDYLVNELKVSESKIEVRPIVIDIDKIKLAPIIDGADLHKKYPQFEKIVLMASRIEPEKNIELAVEAFKTVSDEMPKVGLVIVGSGSQISKLKFLISKNKLSNSVIFEPWASPETLYSYYKTADVFLLTSLFEGYGMTLVEAHAAGCKIVSTDVGVARELGATITSYEADEVANKILEILN